MSSSDSQAPMCASTPISITDRSGAAKMCLKKGGPLEVQLVSVPPFFLCPISLELMKDPVTLSSGQTFDRSSIQKWLDEGHGTCPVTRMAINAEQEDPIPNHALRRMIQAWCVQNKSSGIECILTPCQPPSLKDIPVLLDHIRPPRYSSADDHQHCRLDALRKLCVLALDRPKARRLLLDAGATPLLSLMLSKSLPLCSKSTEVEEILWLLVSLAEASSRFHWEPTCTEEVTALAEIIADGKCRAEVRRNAAILLSRAAAEPLDCMKREVRAVQGFMGGVVGLIREDSAASTASWQTSASMASFEQSPDYFCNAGLSLLLAMCSSSMKSRELAIEAGALDAVASLFYPDATGTTCPDMMNTRTIEHGLKVWECLCKSAHGRAATYLFMGLLVGLMCTVSDKATKYTIRILWLLLNCVPIDAHVAKFAIEHGAFLKVMAVAQSAVSRDTRSLAAKIGKSLSAFVVTSHSRVHLR